MSIDLNQEWNRISPKKVHGEDDAERKFRELFEDEKPDEETNKGKKIQIKQYRSLLERNGCFIISNEPPLEEVMGDKNYQNAYYLYTKKKKNNKK
jgi:hypothetical protein